MKKLFALVLMFLVFAGVLIADPGEGTASVLPTSAVTSSTGNTLVLTIAKGATNYNSGYVAVTVPAGWTAPSLTSSDDGYFTFAMSGSGVISGVAVTSQLILFDVQSWTTGNLVVTLGDTSGGGAGLTAPSSSGKSNFDIGTDPDATYEVTSINAPPSMDIFDPTETPTATNTGTETSTGTETATGTTTNTPTITQTNTQTITETITQTVTRTITETITETVTRTTTGTITETVTQTVTPTITQISDAWGGGVETRQLFKDQSGLEIIYSGTAELLGVMIISTDCTSQTLTAYDASSIGNTTAVNYRWTIAAHDCTKLPKYIKFSGDFWYNGIARPWAYRFDNGIVFYRTSSSMEVWAVFRKP